MSAARCLVACLSLMGFVFGGCRTGTGDYRHATDPAGVSVQLDLGPGQTAGGELLEVQEGGLLLAHPRELIVFPFARIRRAEFAQFDDLTLTGAAPTAAQRERLRLLSRFPQGLTPALRTALLATRNQAEYTTWAP